MSDAPSDEATPENVNLILPPWQSRGALNLLDRASGQQN